MNMKLASLLLTATSTIITPALAQSAGDWTLGIGVHVLDPQSNAGHLGALPSTRINTDTRPTLTAEYFVREGWGIEVIAAAPFQHEISIDSLGKVGSSKHLPPTVSLQYHFNSVGKVAPFIGLGVNYTRFFSERTQGVLEGDRLDLDASWGLAGHAGVDIQLSEKYALRVDARYIDISTDVQVNGEKVGKLDIDPLVYGAALVVKF